MYCMLDCVIDWCQYYVEGWCFLVDQCDVDVEFVVVFDEFVGVVEWIDQLIGILVLVYFLWYLC